MVEGDPLPCVVGTCAYFPVRSGFPQMKTYLRGEEEQEGDGKVYNGLSCNAMVTYVLPVLPD